MITMVLGGLWHGAAWTFVLWGALHGAGARRRARARGRGSRLPPSWLRWLITFNLVVLGWILFRAPDLGIGGHVPRAPRRARARRRCGRPRSSLAGARASSACSSLPERAARARARLRFEAPQPRRARRRAGDRASLFVGATVPGQGVPPFIYFRFWIDACDPDHDKSDDSLDDRFDRHGPRASARATRSSASALCALLLVLFEGRSMRRAGRGDATRAGSARSCSRVGDPPRAGSPTASPLATRVRHARRLGCIPDETCSAAPAASTRRAPRAAAGGVPPVTPDAFDPRALGDKPRRQRAAAARCWSPATRCRSRSTPSSRARSRRSGVKVVRDAAHRHRASPRPTLVDWGKLSVAQVAQATSPDAVVVFIGANEGFPMRGRGGQAASSAAAPTGRRCTPTACGR